MKISLTPEHEAMVQEKVKSGMYHSAGEVICEALYLMQEQDQFRQMKLDNLRKKVAIAQEQYERGEVHPWDPEQFKKECRARKAKESANEKD